jgi:hypothetical protein
MIRKLSGGFWGGWAELTEDEWDDEDLNVLCAGFVGVSRKIGNVQAQGGIVAQDSVEICEEDSS